MREKILIVEDNPRNLKLVEMTLRGKGYELLEATDGEQALDVAMRERPNLIIMDVQLPKLDGLEVTKRLRVTSVSGRIPIIALTAYAMKGDREKAIAAGCDEYVSKPIDTRQFPEVVAQMLRRGRDKP